MKPRFTCQIGQFPTNTFIVVAVIGQYEGISRGYRYQLALLIPNGVDPTQLLPMPVTVFGATGTRIIYGMIAEFCEGEQQTPQHSHLTVWIEPWFNRLRYQKRSRVFVEKTAEDITRQILTENGINASQWRWHASQTAAKPLSLLLQKDQNDADFLQGLWSVQGISFVFLTDGSLQLGDCAQLANALPESYQQCQQLVYHAPKGMARDPINVFDWSYTEESGKAPLLTLKTLRDDIRPGDLVHFTVPGSLHEWVTGEYRVIGRTMTSDQRLAFFGNLGSNTTVNNNAHGNSSHHNNNINPEFCCTLELMPCTVPFVTPQQPMQIFPGLYTAHIDKDELDSQGDYLLRFPFDESEGIPLSPGSNRVRFATPFSGKGYGWHFPLRAKTQIVVTLHHLPDGSHEATIVGTLPETESPAPVNASAHPSVHRLRTHGDTVFEATDHKDNAYTAMMTRNRDNEIRLSGNPQDDVLRMHSVQQGIQLSAGDNIDITCHSSHIHAQENLIETVNERYTLLAEQDIQISAHDAELHCAKETRICADTNTHLTADTLTWSARKIFYLNVSGSMHCWAEQFTIEGHHIQLQVTDDTPLVLAQGESRWQMDGEGNMALFANRLIMEAPIISLYSEEEASC